MTSGIYIRTERHKQITSDAVKRFYQNGGINPRGMKDKKHTEESRRKLREAYQKRKSSGEKIGFQKRNSYGKVNKGKKYSNRKRRSDADISTNIEILRKVNIGNKYTKGIAPWNKHLTKQTDNRLKQMGERRKGKFGLQKEKHPMWKGGISEIKTLAGKERIAGRKRPDLCEACGLIETKSSRSLCFDHNHITGKFRGWICHHCNLALGHTKDDSVRLLKLIKYLQNNI